VIIPANAIRYAPSGPVGKAFFVDRSEVAAINGPIGGGKTTTCLMRMVRTAMDQQQSWKDGLRKFKICVVRDTYRQLWKTTIPSWHKQFPEDVGRWVGSRDAPALHELQFGLPDRSIVDLKVEFLAIGENAAEDVLKGYEPTAFYLNENDTLAQDVRSIAQGRAGRYPGMDEGGPTWFGIIEDFNAPSLGNHCYKTWYVPKLPPGWKFFRQPSGLSPDAENLVNLPKNYYVRQMAGQPEWYIDKFIRNKPGVSRAGKPVYPEFNDALHVADSELKAVEGLPLLIGLDAGGNPAAVIGQRMPNGQWRILDELLGEQNTGPRRFGQMLAKLLQDKYPEFGVTSPAPYRGSDPEEGERYSRHGSIRAWADPSAVYGADRVAGEQDWTEIVSAEAGIRVDAAPTNNPTARQEAVRTPLTRLIDGQPGYLLSPTCAHLREGFNAGYRFRKVRSGGEEKFTDEVDKNEYSHDHDANQYLLSAGGEDLAIRGRRERSGFQALRGMRHESDWDPFNVGQ
jgi:hypothetical protein